MRVKLMCILAIALSACSTSSALKPANHVAFWPQDKPNGCKVKIFQGEGEVVPVERGDGKTYKLLPKKFRIEVTPAECSPTIALVTPNQLEYILQTPLVFSSGGVFMAGVPAEANILTGIVGDNPRTSLTEVASSTNQPDWVKQQYDELCKSLGYCPNPALAFSSAWPFLDPVSMNNRNYAEFSRFSKFESMSAASGRTLHAVVYTNWQTLTKKAGFSQSVIYVLHPNSLVLEFQ